MEVYTIGTKKRHFWPLTFLLTLLVPIPGESKKLINFYFPTSLWCLKRFYEGLKGHKEVKIKIYVNFYFNTVF